MSAGRVADAFRALGPGPDSRSDGELVLCFAADRESQAFAELMRRHGPTVFGVCRRILGHVHDAEDAFQAVWLVLARRAGAVHPPGSVGSFLYGVAVRTATKARALAAKRRQRQRAAARSESVEDPPMSTSDLRVVLDEELSRLPEKYRIAVVLCDLGGKSRSAAAAELGWPEGTVAARLAEGRRRLAERLGQRGVALSAAGLAAAIAPAATACPVPANLAADALVNALAYAAGGTAAVPPASMALAEGVMRTMWMSRWKLPVGVVLVCGLAAGVIVAASPGPAPEEPRGPAPPATNSEPGQARGEPTRLTEHIGFVHSVAFAPDGRTFAAAGADGKVIQWNSASRKVRWTFTPPEAHRSAVAYSPDGKLVAATFRDGVRLLDAATGKQIDTVAEEGSAALSVAFAPDRPLDGSHLVRKILFSNGMSTYVKSGVKWDQAGTARFDSGPGIGGGIGVLAAPLAVSPDGLRAVLTRHEKMERKFVMWVWSAGSGVPNALLKGHSDTVFAAVWSKDGKAIATAGADGQVIVWAARPTGKTVKQPGGSEVNVLEFSEQKRFELPERSIVYALAISPDGNSLAGGGLQAGPKGREPTQIWRWDLAAGKPMEPLAVSENEAVASLAYSPDGRTLVGSTGDPYSGRHPGGDGGGVWVWDLTAKK